MKNKNASESPYPRKGIAVELLKIGADQIMNMLAKKFEKYING